jgi:transposase
MTGHVTLSVRELDRLDLMVRITERRLTQRHAAELLGVSERQVRRLYRGYKRDGAAALVSKKRGRPSPRQLPVSIKRQALDLIREKYSDFGPTLAHEKLTELYGLELSVETLRMWMMEDGIWLSRSKRARRSYPPRERRACLGELVQIDGCDHEWFEERGPRCTLLVYVDDATGRLMELRFAESESTFDYFQATRSYIERHGKPVTFYSDRHGIFHVYARDRARTGAGLSQFGRALEDLNIDIVCANTPQAKGRVERAHQTLQDRLVKELRLRGLSSIEEAAPYLEEFREDYNRRFSRHPRSTHDAHRALRDAEKLDEIFTLHERRRVTEELALHYKRGVYVIEDSEENRKLRGARATVHEHEDGTVKIRHEGRELRYHLHLKDEARVTQASIVEHERLEAALRWIAEKQKQRDLERLANPKITLRGKRRIRENAAQSAL